jgi:hypothetical protein
MMRAVRPLRIRPHPNCTAAASGGGIPSTERRLLSASVESSTGRIRKAFIHDRELCVPMADYRSSSWSNGQTSSKSKEQRHRGQWHQTNEWTHAAAGAAAGAASPFSDALYTCHEKSEQPQRTADVHALSASCWLLRQTRLAAASTINSHRHRVDCCATLPGSSSFEAQWRPQLSEGPWDSDCTAVRHTGLMHRPLATPDRRNAHDSQPAGVWQRSWIRTAAAASAWRLVAASLSALPRSSDRCIQRRGRSGRSGSQAGRVPTAG